MTAYSRVVEIALEDFVRRAKARKILDLRGSGLWCTVGTFPNCYDVVVPGAADCGAIGRSVLAPLPIVSSSGRGWECPIN